METFDDIKAKLRYSVVKGTMVICQIKALVLKIQIKLCDFVELCSDYGLHGVFLGFQVFQLWRLLFDDYCKIHSDSLFC